WRRNLSLGVKKKRQIQLISILASVFMFFSILAPSIVGATSKQGLQEYMIDSNTTNTDKITDDLRAAFNEKEYVSFLIKFKKKANVKDAINKAKTKAEKEGLSSRKAEHLRNS